MTVVHTFDRSRGQALIGFSGRAGAGKDSCAQALVAHGFHSVAFADELRRQVQAAWRIDPRMLVDRTTKELPVPAMAIANCADAAFVELMRSHGEDLQSPRSARWLLQRWGTEYRRASNENYWIEQALLRLRRLRAGGVHRICITDVRFANEARTIDALGGQVLLVVRPDLPALDDAAATHASEAGHLPPPAGIVHNDGTLDHLQSDLWRVLLSIGCSPAEALR